MSIDPGVVERMESIFNRRIIELLLLLRQKKGIPLHMAIEIVGEDMIHNLLNSRIIDLRRTNETITVYITYPKGELISKAIYEIYTALREE